MHKLDGLAFPATSRQLAKALGVGVGDLPPFTVWLTDAGDGSRVVGRLEKSARTGRWAWSPASVGLAAISASVAHWWPGYVGGVRVDVQLTRRVCGDGPASPHA